MEPSVSVEPESLELLRELVRTAATELRCPDSEQIRRNNRSRGWVVDDLVRNGLVEDLHGHLTPTIAGLRLAETVEATDLLSAIQDTLPLLRGLLDHGASRQMSADSPPWSSRQRMAITILATTQGLWSGKSHEPTSGLLISLGWAPAIHDFDLDQAPDSNASAVAEPRAGGEPLTITAKDFCGLREVRWSPSGVCLVAGTNGTGKTSLLRILELLRDALTHGVSEAIKFQHGSAGLRRLGASGPPEVRLGCAQGELSWELRLQLGGGTVAEFPAETFRIGDRLAVRRAALSSDIYINGERTSSHQDRRTGLRILVDSHRPPEAMPLVEKLAQSAYYSSYSLDPLRAGGSGGEADDVLDPTGANLFIVLRNWKVASRKYRDQFQWVIGKMRLAFPDLIDDVEPLPPIGQIVPTQFYIPGQRQPLPIHRAADGVLVGLLHLTAVAGAPDGGIVAIDEMENQLHPHAIRVILSAMRELADERGLTIILATHSPVLMNEFRHEPERLFVMELGRDLLPVPLSEIHDPEWLAHFSLGDLYDRLEFGAPRIPER